MKLLFVTFVEIVISLAPLSHIRCTAKTYRLVFSLVIVWPLKSACWETELSME